MIDGRWMGIKTVMSRLGSGVVAASSSQPSKKPQAHPTSPFFPILQSPWAAISPTSAGFQPVNPTSTMRLARFTSPPASSAASSALGLWGSLPTSSAAATILVQCPAPTTTGACWLVTTTISFKPPSRTASTGTGTTTTSRTGPTSGSCMRLARPGSTTMPLLRLVSKPSRTWTKCTSWLITTAKSSRSSSSTSSAPMAVRRCTPATLVTSSRPASSLASCLMRAIQMRRSRLRWPMSRTVRHTSISWTRPLSSWTRRRQRSPRMKRSRRLRRRGTPRSSNEEERMG